MSVAARCKPTLLTGEGAADGQEGLTDVWALRDALEKERAARRIPADAVIRAEARACKAEAARAEAEAAATHTAAEAATEVARVKEECARERQRACEEVDAMQAMLKAVQTDCAVQVTRLEIPN